MKGRETSFILNDKIVRSEAPSGSALIDVIRSEQHLTGTKIVCREGDCGACSVIVGESFGDKLVYKNVTSCIFPLCNVEGKHVITIEGLNNSGLSLIQKYFADEHASQCGFCTPGFIISLTSYLINNDSYNVDEAVNSVAGNICRCTGYFSIKRAIEKTLKELSSAKSNNKNHLEFLIKNQILPETFSDMKDKLNELKKTIPARETQKSSVIIGGGTDMLVQIPEKCFDTESYSNSTIKPGYIIEDDENIIIGGSTSFEEFKNSKIIKKYFSDIEKSLNLIASLPIRNAATIAGNIVNASPIGDLTIFLLPLNTKLFIVKDDKTKTVDLDDFYKGYKQIKKNPDEKIEEIIVPKPTDNYKFSFEKVSKRTYLDIASVNSALIIKVEENFINEIKISAGGVTPVPKLLTQTSNFLSGMKLTSELIENTLEIVQQEITPISDVRGSKEYKRLLLNQLIKAHFIKLFPEIIEAGEFV